LHISVLVIRCHPRAYPYMGMEGPGHWAGS
jgi:hypothetical protein